MSTTPEYTKQEIIDMIIYIKQKTPDIALADRKEVLRIIMKSGIDDHKIQSKGNGTQIKFKDLPNNTIIQVYNFIKMKILDKMQKLEQLTEEPTGDPE
jgi:hypothetical protein